LTAYTSKEMAINCSLYREKIPSAIKEFAAEKGIEWSCTSNGDFQDTFKLTYDKANRFITIYYKKNGLTSISHQGSNKTSKLGEECCEYIISKTSLPDSIHKTFSIKNSNLKNYEYFKTEIGDEHIVILNSNDTNVLERIKVKDDTGATITVTIYKNATLFFQGAITPLFVSLMNAALLWMLDDVDENNSIIGLKNVSCNIESDVTKHIDHIEKLKPDGDVMIKMIESSLQLVNSGISVSDYGCYTFGVLKAIEGILKLRIQEDVYIFENFGDYFIINKNKGTYHFKTSLYDEQPNLKKALEKAYNHFHKYRHSTFHVDDQIETTKILNYSEAMSIIVDSIHIINEICNNW
jgi:hypothetical protein